MRTPLPVGTNLTLSAIGTKQQITVQIQELIGTGASCLVYTAVCRDGEQNEFYLRLKEFCPENLHLIRQQDGSLLAADNAAFQRQMQSFIWPANKSQEAKWNFYKIFTEEKVGTTNRPSKRSEKRNAVVFERSSGCAVLAFRIDE